MTLRVALVMLSMLSIIVSHALTHSLLDNVGYKQSCTWRKMHGMITVNISVEVGLGPEYLYSVLTICATSKNHGCEYLL